MTALRTRFIEDMQLHGYSPKTQSCYVGAVCGLARHYHKSPDLISEEELRRYFLHLTGPCTSCASCDSPITRPLGCSPRSPATDFATACSTTPGRSLAAPCSAPCCKPASARLRTCTVCATVWRRICWKRASTCGS